MSPFKGIFELSTPTKDLEYFSFSEKEVYEKVVGRITDFLKDDSKGDFIEINETHYGRDFLKGCRIYYKCW